MFRMLEATADKLGIGDLMLVIASAAVIIVIILLAVVMISRSRNTKDRERSWKTLARGKTGEKESGVVNEGKGKENHAHTGSR
jgi:hypothetical protein